MIPRTARRLETTLLLSRQRLPRSARLFSTPSKKANAPAALAAAAPNPDYPLFLNKHEPLPEDVAPLSHDMKSFLGRRPHYTLLPTPLPDDETSPVHELYFTDTSTQDQLAVVDACLHNLYDVERAKHIFMRLREQKGNPVLVTRLYNSLLEAFIGMASSPSTDSKEVWLQDAWDLYDDMENGREVDLHSKPHVVPNSGTYAIMLIAWHRFHEGTLAPVRYRTMKAPTDILVNIVEREISVSSVVSDRAFVSSEEASDVIKILSQAAVQLGLSRIVMELGQAEALGTYDDPLENIPEVMPVRVVAKKTVTPEDQADIDARVKAGETVIEKEPEMIVPFNLDSLRRHLAQAAMARRVLPEDVASRQKLLEESVYSVAEERLKRQAETFESLGLSTNGLMAPDLQRWMWEWHTKLQERLATEIKAISTYERNRPSKIAIERHQDLSPFLSLVKAEKLSLITILEIMRLQGTGGITDGMKTARALIAVGHAVEMEYKAQMCKKNKIAVPTSGHRPESYFTNLGYRDLHARRVTARKYMEDAEEWTAPWTQRVRVKVGSILVECLMEVAEVTRTAVSKINSEIISEVQPAFFHSYEYSRGQKLGVLRLNPVVAERIAKDGLRETLHPRHLPMLTKPKPWLNHDEGGYIYNKTSAMRFKDSQEQQSYLKRASSLGNVELVYAGLDVLGSTPWVINKSIFDVVIQVWNSGHRMGKLPPAVYDKPEPDKPDNFATDFQARSIHLQRQRGYVQAKAGNHSDRCSVNYKIEIARAFLGDTLYLPHNLDFRGRAYPIPPHLNHLGDDLSRGLLKFAEQKPLGERGLRWLKIHLANLYGFDKANFDERVAFVEEHLEVIYDSATKPLDGKRWWLTADDPWQCLATCMELHSALESPDPHEFMSSLPVHQDGTCNGLQHYAALGGDARGAAQVNLSVTDRPSDVYTFVGNMVEKLLEEDIKKGEPYAKLLQGKISRKVVKQTVMTTVYGVTFVGARDQIEKQLKDRKDIPEEDCWPAASYLAKQVLLCIGDLFSGAKAIQTWLNLCARLISKSIPEERLPEAIAEHELSQQKKLGQPKKLGRKKMLPVDRLRREQMTSVVWTTPLGLPIVQPYRKTKRKQISTTLQSVYISDPNSPAEVNSQKQASAFPPNFIHSLDATHMMLTALECRTQGLNFASVHDSYWTHACSIDKMSEIIRDTFIALHSSDVLGKLHGEFMERYKGYKVPLIALRTTSLSTGLHAAGTRIVVTPKQARSLSAIKDLLVVSDTEEPDVEESSTSALTDEQRSKLATDEDLALEAWKKEVTEVAPKKRATKPRKKAAAKIKIIEDEDIVDHDAEEADPEEVDLDAAELENLKDDEATNALLGKFVDLTALFPPLPAKGNFEVETIKGSQYFFS